MATNDTFTVAVELGSSEVSVIAGKKDADGSIKILASLQEPSNSFIRKGRINNIDKMSQFILSMKERLEKQLKMSVSKVYVGIGGMGMHTVANKERVSYEESTKVTEEVVNTLLQDNRHSSSDEWEILEVVPQEYQLGAQKALEPIGMLTEQLTGNFLNIVSSTSARKQIIDSFNSTGLKVAGTPIGVLTKAHYMTNESERRSGCVFVDMGAETTSVAIYKNNLLRHLAVLPLGGANISRDIASIFQIEESEAEALKREYFSAVMDDAEVENHGEIALQDGRSVRFADFYEAAQARLQEIIVNVEYQVTATGFHNDALIAGFVLTGGVAKTKGIEKAFTLFAKANKIALRQNISIQARTKESDFNREGSFNTALAILDTHNDNCAGGPLNEAPAPQIFPTEEELEAKRQAQQEALLKAQQEAAEAEEQLRQEKEEEEKRLAEAERKRKPGAIKKFWGKATAYFQSIVSEEE